MEDAHLGHPYPFLFIKNKKKEEFYFYHEQIQRKTHRGCHWYDLGAAAAVAKVANMTSPHVCGGSGWERGKKLMEGRNVCERGPVEIEMRDINKREMY